jgi:hypothetical protein
VDGIGVGDGNGLATILSSTPLGRANCGLEGVFVGAFAKCEQATKHALAHRYRHIILKVFIRIILAKKEFLSALLKQ